MAKHSKKRLVLIILTIGLAFAAIALAKAAQHPPNQATYLLGMACDEKITRGYVATSNLITKATIEKIETEAQADGRCKEATVFSIQQINGV